MAHIPKLRFKGFTEEWEQRKVGEITSVLSGSRVHKDDWTANGVPFYRSSDVVSAYKGTQNVKAFISHELFESLAATSGKLEKGDILITGGGSIGIPYIVPDSKPLYTKDADLIWVKKSTNHDSKYLYTYFESKSFREYLNSISHTGTISHYTIEQVKATPVSMPILEEQKKIGELFTAMDHLITLHRHKCDSLKQVKKYMLQKMFPKQGEKVPEIRFAGFTGEWEQRRFGDVGSVSMCKRIFKDETTDEGDIPFFKIGTFGGEPDAYISRLLFEDYKAKYPYPNKGDILLSASGTIGRMVEYNGEEAYFQDSNIVWLSHDQSIDNTYLKVLYEIVRWDGIEGSTIQRLYNDNFLKTKFLMPNKYEQKKIGAYFAGIDSLIALHQRKVDSLKEIKKFMLQNMFPK